MGLALLLAAHCSSSSEAAGIFHSPHFIYPSGRTAYGKPSIIILRAYVISMQVNTGNSILSELTKRELSKRVGHFGFKVTYRTREGETLSSPSYFLTP